MYYNKNVFGMMESEAVGLASYVVGAFFYLSYFILL